MNSIVKNSRLKYSMSAQYASQYCCYYLFGLLLFLSSNITAQGRFCVSDSEKPRSLRLANYDMNIVLDHEMKKVQGSQEIVWVNNSPDTIDHIEMYMYLNAFKNSESSYLKGSGMNIMGQDLSSRTKETWGYINILSALQKGNNAQLKQSYIQDLDDNKSDQSVLQLELVQSILPGDSLFLSTEFESKLPKTISRVGYSTNNFFHFVHWYPKLGVYEQDQNGKWDWNCHQFLRQMEFYGEFGNYNVNITCSNNLVIGASGCRTAQVQRNDETVTHSFEARDVIDFAWCAYPDFIVYEDNWNGIDIELLSPPQHKEIVPRLMGALKNSLQYLTDHVGEYPYPKITVMDPPALGLRSGFMEYPTYITGGSFYAFPSGIKTLESLIAHEFSHQYFMGILASNEKESPWLDEGFVTFFEDCIMEKYYGSTESLFDIGGYKVSNSEFTRIEYTSLPDKRIGQITEKSWLVPGSYKGIVYSKTATMFRTIRNIIGEEVFYRAFRSYFEINKFTHPRKADFLKSFYSVIEQDLGHDMKATVSEIMNQALDQTVVCDFAVRSISNNRLNKPTGLFSSAEKDRKLDYWPHEFMEEYYSQVVVQQLGDMIIPVDVKISFSDGSVILEKWNGVESTMSFEYTGLTTIVSAEIDPDSKIYLDVDFNNNSMTLAPKKMGIVKYASRMVFWVQNILQSVSFLM